MSYTKEYLFSKMYADLPDCVPLKEQELIDELYTEEEFEKLLSECDETDN